jgi:hypothetical protein
MVLTGL